MSAAEIAAMQDDRAAAAGLRSDALMAQSNKLKGDAIDNFVAAGTTAITQGVEISDEISGLKAQGAIDKLVAGGMTIPEAQKVVTLQSKKNTRLYNSGKMDTDAFTGTTPKYNSNPEFNPFTGMNILSEPLNVVENLNPFLSPSGMKNMFPGVDIKNIFNTDYTTMADNKAFDEYMLNRAYQQEIPK